VQRLYGITIPLLLVAVEAIPTIPMLPPVSLTSGIVAGDDGTVYFADSFHNTVWQISPGGRVSPFLTGRSGRSLQLDDRGNIYGTHQEQRGRVALWRADPAGLVTELHRTSLWPDHNHAFAVGDGGRIIGWSGGRRRSGVQLWRGEPDSQQLLAGSAWGFRDGRGDAARFFAIGAMAHTATGDLIVTSGATVRRICRDGVVTTIAADDPLLLPRTNLLSRLFGQRESHLSGVAHAANGDIYVANSARGTLVRIGSDGRTSNALVSEAGWTPTGVAVAPGGVVYVLEYGAGVRVRRLGDGPDQFMAHVRATGATVLDIAV
jgi:hypothetical protein